MPDLPIDTTSSLPGTVKYYEQHLIICTGHADWPGKIEAGGGLIEALISGINRSPLAKMTRVTACDRPSVGAGTDLLVYPEGILLQGLQEEDLPRLLRYLLGDGEVDFNRTPIEKHQFFICSHGRRDDRCGRCGPPIRAALHRYLAHEDLMGTAEVWGSSHLGGHRFAGVLVCYPSGNWYGRVEEADIPSLAAIEIQNQRPNSRHWRGRLGLTVQEQIALATLLEDRQAGTG